MALKAAAMNATVGAFDWILTGSFSPQLRGGVDGHRY
jgi:hypothetical protein